MDHEAAERVGIAVFAKAPIEGYAKTRLAPRLGADGAAEVHRMLLERTVATACAARLGPVSLWCAPECTHPDFVALGSRYGVELHAQRGRDLGERMLHAFRVLTPRGALLLVGADCAVISAALLVRCALELQGGASVVLLPAEDGGYVLLGATQPLPALLLGIEWGTDGVLEETRRRLRGAGLSFAEPATLWDVDRPEDYDRALALGLLTPPGAAYPQA
jgi:rSAM/selenodomain-associated transferase 1